MDFYSTEDHRDNVTISRMEYDALKKKGFMLDAIFSIKDEPSWEIEKMMNTFFNMLYPEQAKEVTPDA